jgi:phosphoglycolate phosphatase
VSTLQCGNTTFENIQAVVFDKDGTLAEAEAFLKSLGQKRSRLLDAQVPGVQEPLRLAFGLEGDRLNPGGLLAVGGRRENEIAAAAYIAETGRDWLEALEIARTGFREADGLLTNKAAQTPPLPGASALLQKLTAAGLKVGILSSDTSENVQSFVQTHQLSASVHLAMGVQPSLSKPDPELLLRACAALGVAPAATLMIGDSTADLAMAHAAGTAGCIGFTGGWSHPPNLRLSLPMAEGWLVIVERLEQMQIHP